MAIATINPATGEMLKTFEPLTAEPSSRTGIARAAAAVRDLPADDVRRSGPAGCARPPTSSTPSATRSPG